MLSMDFIEDRSVTCNFLGIL